MWMPFDVNCDLVLIRHLANANEKYIKIFAHKLFAYMFYSSGSFFVRKHRHLHYTEMNRVAFVDEKNACVCVCVCVSFSFIGNFPHLRLPLAEHEGVMTIHTHRVGCFLSATYRFSSFFALEGVNKFFFIASHIEYG